MDRHKLRVALLSLGVACVFVLSLPKVAEAANAFELGHEEFKLKRYRAAKEQFMNAVTQNPSNQKAYLYLGKCLEFLREPEDAQATYRACYAVNPFSEEGKRAKQFSMDVAGRLEAADHRAVDAPETVINSGLLIQRQALDLQARKIREANSYAKNRRSVNRRQGYFYTPEELTRRREPGDEVSNRDFINNAHGIYDTTTESYRARAHGQKVAQSVQDTANALIERLGRKTNSSSPALRALGTSLYVQYFRSMTEEEDIPPPPDPPIELRARQLKFSDIPRAWKAQSKIFKFPTLGPEDLLPLNKTENVEQALFDKVAKEKTAAKATRPSAPRVIPVAQPTNVVPTTVVPPTTDPPQADAATNIGANAENTRESSIIKEPKPFNWTP